MNAKRAKPWSLAEWREGRKLSQREAADAIGCSRQSIDNWENGHTDMPRYIRLACAAIDAGIVVDDGASP